MNAQRELELEKHHLRMVAEVRNLLLDAQVEMQRCDRERELIASAAYDRLRMFVCDRLSKGDLESVTAALEDMPPEYIQWANRIREVYELAVGEVENKEKGNGHNRS